MALPDVRNALKVKGRLCWNPSDLSTAYPHGGTALGYVRSVAIEARTSSRHFITAEEFNGAKVRSFYSARELVLTAILASWDTDALASINPDTSTGSTTGRRVIRYRATNDDTRAGKLADDLAGVLYFSPIAEQHPGVLFYRAEPSEPEGSKWEMNLASEFGLPLVWVATPNENDDIARVGLVGDLTL